MKLITTGSTRWVVLIGQYAVKFPRPTSWWSLLNGMLANLNERRFGRGYSQALAHVFFADPMGFVVVMERCAAVPVGTATSCELGGQIGDDIEVTYETENPEICEAIFADRKGNRLPLELKDDGFGVAADGRIVGIDYGN